MSPTLPPLMQTFPLMSQGPSGAVGGNMELKVGTRQFAATHDMNVKDEIERLAKEYGKLKEPWRFVSK